MKYFDQMVDDAISQLSDDRVDAGVELLRELAVVFKSAGMTRQSFAEMCQYIENEASERSDSAFVQLKMQTAFKKAKEGKIIVGVH